MQAFTLYVTVTDGIDPNAPAAQDPGDADAPAGGTGGGGGAGGGEAKPKPKVMLGGYSVNPSPVLAGQEFGLSVTLQNTSDSQPIKNMKVTVSGETADIIPMGGDQFLLLQKGGQTGKRRDRYQADGAADGGVQATENIAACRIRRDGGTEVTSDESIVIQVKQPVRIEYDEPEIPAGGGKRGEYDVRLHERDEHGARGRCTMCAWTTWTTCKASWMRSRSLGTRYS